jgi:hypothetical protein
MFRQPVARDQEQPAKPAQLDRVLLIVTALYALLPFGRLVVTGEGNQVDMGVATILLVLVLSSLLRRRAPMAAAAAEVGEEKP